MVGDGVIAEAGVGVGVLPGGAALHALTSIDTPTIIRISTRDIELAIFL
jgi:hypothetical protein